MYFSRQIFWIWGILPLTVMSVAEARSESPKTALERAMDGTFTLLVDGHMSGSGVIISSDGLVLTAAHQVQGMSVAIEARSRLIGRQKLEVVALDIGSDIALMKLPKRDRIYPYVSLADRFPRVSDPVFLIGSPIYRHALYHAGSIASSSVAFEYLPSRKHYVEALYVNGSSPPGTSGGPWVNTKGQIVGTQIGLMHNQTHPTHIAYMSPLQDIRTLIERSQTIRTPTLFVAVEEFWEQEEEYRAQFPSQQEGLVVAQLNVPPTHPRSKLKVGDLMISIDQKPVVYREDLLREIRRKNTGDHVVVGIMGRNGKISQVELIVGEL